MRLYSDVRLQTTIRDQAGVQFEIYCDQIDGDVGPWRRVTDGGELTGEEQDAVNEAVQERLRKARTFAGSTVTVDAKKLQAVLSAALRHFREYDNDTPASRRLQSAIFDLETDLRAG